MVRNGSLTWERFQKPFVDSFVHRRYIFSKFVDCSYRKVRRLPQPPDCYHYRYVPKTESQLLELAGRDMVEAFDERLRLKRIQPSEPLPAPAGGYHNEPEGLLLSGFDNGTRGCVINGSTVNCSFVRQRREHQRCGRLAILITGIKDRYYPRSVFKHVVAPAARAGCQVDYYALLDWEKTIMVDRLTSEAVGLFNPIKTGTGEDGGSVPNPQVVNASMHQVLSLVARYARQYGVAHLFLRFLRPGLKEDPPRIGCRRYLGQGSANVLNYRRTRLTFKNVQLLWEVVQGRLQRESQGARPARYTHVLWQREDMHWTADLNLAHFTDPGSVYGYAMVRRCEPVPVGAARNGNFADKTLLVGGVAAMSFFRLYDIVNCISA